MGQFDFYGPLFGWWLLIPILLVATCVLCALRWRWRISALIAVLSVIGAVIVSVMLPLSWSTHYDIIVWWDDPQPDGEIHCWNLYLVSDGGGVRLSLLDTEVPHPPRPLGPVEIHLRRGVLGASPPKNGYPIWDHRFMQRHRISLRRRWVSSFAGRTFRKTADGVGSGRLPSPTFACIPSPRPTGSSCSPACLFRCSGSAVPFVSATGVGMISVRPAATTCASRNPDKPVTNAPSAAPPSRPRPTPPAPPPPAQPPPPRRSPRPRRSCLDSPCPAVPIAPPRLRPRLPAVVTGVMLMRRRRSPLSPNGGKTEYFVVFSRCAGREHSRLLWCGIGAVLRRRKPP